MYYTDLQAEITTNITRLTDIHTDITKRFTRIMIKVDFADFAPTASRTNQSTGAPQPKTRYLPQSTFLEQGGNKDRARPWYTIASDLMSETDVTIITEWLHSGGQYASYADPARFLKLLLDEETGRVLTTTLKEKVTPEDPHLTVEEIMDTLED